MLIVSLLLYLFIVVAAEQDFMTYENIPLKLVVEMSRKAGLQVECRKSHMIALTFDDGIVSATEEILDVLDDMGVPATFFLVGRYMDEYDNTHSVLKRMKRSGHTIGTHSIAHTDLSWLSNDEILRNFKEPAETIENHIGYKPRFVRPPYGSYSQAVLDTAKHNGFIIVNWNADSNDWRYGAYDDPQSIIDNVSSQEGGKMSSKILLMHDRTLTASALKGIIRFYKRKGYSFVNMRECLGESAYF